jgi:acylphosphatase
MLRRRPPMRSARKRRPPLPISGGESPMDDVIRRFLVIGKVQGVYFRHSARLEANRLQVRGLARNLRDGSVEVLAQGSPSGVEALRQWLHCGPAHARVEAVREADAVEALSEIPAGFEVF